jgi:hypothetical protein
VQLSAVRSAQPAYLPPAAKIFVCHRVNNCEFARRLKPEFSNYAICAGYKGTTAKTPRWPSSNSFLGVLGVLAANTFGS